MFFYDLFRVDLKMSRALQSIRSSFDRVSFESPYPSSLNRQACPNIDLCQIILPSSMQIIKSYENTSKLIHKTKCISDVK